MKKHCNFKTLVYIFGILIFLAGLRGPSWVFASNLSDLSSEWKVGQAWTVKVQRYQIEKDQEGMKNQEPVLGDPTLWDYIVYGEAIVDGEPAWVLGIFDCGGKSPVASLYVRKTNLQALRLVRHEPENESSLDYYTASNAPTAILSDGFFPPVDFPVFSQQEASAIYTYIPLMDGTSRRPPIEATQTQVDTADGIEVQIASGDVQVIQQWERGKPWWSHAEMPGVFMAETVDFQESV